VDELNNEIARLDDAIAQMGLSSAGARTANRCRRRAGALEYSFAAIALIGPSRHLQHALSADVSVARDVLSKKLGDIVVEERRNVTTECMRRWTSAPYCFAQPRPMFLSLVAGAGFEPATFGL